MAHLCGSDERKGRVAEVWYPRTHRPPALHLYVLSRFLYEERSTGTTRGSLCQQGYKNYYIAKEGVRKERVGFQAAVPQREKEHRVSAKE